MSKARTLISSSRVCYDLSACFAQDGRLSAVPAPYRPMLLSAVVRPRAGDDWAHEPKLDGWRAIVEVSGGRVPRLEPQRQGLVSSAA
jgi:hypothetical protein